MVAHLTRGIKVLPFIGKPPIMVMGDTAIQIHGPGLGTKGIDGQFPNIPELALAIGTFAIEKIIQCPFDLWILDDPALKGIGGLFFVPFGL